VNPKSILYPTFTDIQHMKGICNLVADSLSRYYQSDTWEDIHSSYDFVNADLQLDSEGEDLPWNQMVKILTIRDPEKKTSS
jgi:hypothetical protein